MQTTTRFPEFNAQVTELLASLQEKLGPPTCQKGCSNCCHFAVSASSAEAAYLLGYIQSRPAEEADRLFTIIEDHVARLVAHFTSIGQTANPLREIWILGGCPFLADNKCSIYPVRPYPCRAVHVWHESRYCVGSSRVPAEFLEIRDINFWETMKREVDAGRRPFWGQLTVVSYFLLLYGQQYMTGGDLRELIDLPWLETKLIQFPGDGPLEQVAVTIDARLDELRQYYAQAETHGLARAAKARSASDLDCDPEEKRRIDEENEALRIIS